MRLTPPPEILNINTAMSKCDSAIAEILKVCTETRKKEVPIKAPAEITPPAEPPKYEGNAALAEYVKRKIKLMPCVPVEDDPKRYRPIVGKDKWDSTATSDIDRIKKYQDGTLWPNVTVCLFRFIPSEAGLLCLDIDKNHSDGADGEANFYRLLRARGYDPLPLMLRDLRAFPVRVETPNGGLHLYFSYNGQAIKKAKLAEGIEVFHVDPLTAAGSRKESGEYVLYGELDNAPPLPAELLEIITDNNTSTHTAPKEITRLNKSSVRGNDDKELLRPRLREYISARGIAIHDSRSGAW